MPGKQVTYIEITPEELNAMLEKQQRDLIHEMTGHIDRITGFLKHQAPSLTRQQAAAYCDRSIAWIDNLRSDKKLPAITVGGHPRILKSHLDHLLAGGGFDEHGNPI